MFNAYIFVVSFAYVILGSSGGKAPFITPCKWDDDKCILNTARPAVAIVAAGIKDLGIPSVDPMKLKKVSSLDGGLKVIFEDLNIIGLAKCHMHSVSRDITKSVINVVLDCPIKATGKYDLKGELLGLPINGKGPCDIESKKLRISATIAFKYIDGHDGKKYWKISKLDYTYKPLENFHFVLENLLSEDQPAATAMMKIIEENSNELIMTVGKPIIDDVIKRCIHSIEKLLLAVPSDELEIV